MCIRDRFVAASLVYFAFASNAFHLMVAAGCLGFSIGIASPAVFAWVIDISPDERRGRSMATVYIALEIGIGGGALLSGWMYANEPSNFLWTYLTAAFLTVLSGVYLQFIYRRKN